MGKRAVESQRAVSSGYGLWTEERPGVRCLLSPNSARR
jgi:hypothetical protein